MSMNKSDIDWALHQIEQMVRIARRSMDEQESLDYALGDILDKVTELKDNWDYTEQPAAAAPDAGSDGERSGSTDEPVRDWRSAYKDLETSVYAVVHMMDFAVEFANDTIDRGEQGVIFAGADVTAGMPFGPALARKDIAGEHDLAAC